MNTYPAFNKNGKSKRKYSSAPTIIPLNNAPKQTPIHKCDILVKDKHVNKVADVPNITS